MAAEPLVADPVDACFDAWGRMFVAEMHGYPFSQEPPRLNPPGGGKKVAGIIRLLEDTDGDGRMDRSVVFADKISWPTSVCCYNGGLFVLAPQYLYYFKDTDGDGRADVREIILSGFGRDNVQSLANNLKWGLDQKIYLAAGRNPLTLKHRDQALFPVQGADLRFDPRTEQFEVVTGGQQFGHSMDDWGNRFGCSNSNHVQQIVFPRRDLARNPALAVSNSIRSIAADGASARVFRTSPPDPWRLIRLPLRGQRAPRTVEGTPDTTVSTLIDFARVWIEHDASREEISIWEFKAVGNDWQEDAPPATNVSGDIEISSIGTDTAIYMPPPDLDLEQDPTTGLILTERSLAFDFEELAVNETVTASRTFVQGEDCTRYGTMRLFVHGGDITTTFPAP